MVSLKMIGDRNKVKLRRAKVIPAAKYLKDALSFITQHLIYNDALSLAELGQASN
ncbi:hypothetical protein [Enterococcus termitis]|uniref:hypothetical protein n=1 Tax=Enterococcus termitis TaxID=332950 RepID=UPI001470F426|nr:hypothetical protein [Enterococcus termitis]